MGVIAKNKKGEIIPEGDTDPEGLMLSAYKNKNGKWSIVVINYSNEDKDISFDIENQKVRKWKMYRTSDAENEKLKPIGNCKENETINITARSIVTFVSE